MDESNPSVNRYGAKIWRLNGSLHREDGPAIVFKDGSEYWYLNGVELSPEEFLEKTPRKVDALFNLR